MDSDIARKVFNICKEMRDCNNLVKNINTNEFH